MVAMDQPIPNRKLWIRRGEIATHPLLNEAYPRLVELIGDSRSAITVAAHIELQRRLAKFGWEIRRFHEDVKAAKERVLADQKTALAAGDTARVHQVSQALPEFELDLAANRRRWTALRAVQDGIIWRLLGFERQRIAILGQAERPVNWLSASFPSEVSAAQEHWEAGRLAVFCDLATCINTGDLLVFDTTQNQVGVVEVKEAADASENTRQLRNARIKVEFLNKGYTDDLAKDAPVLGPGSRPPIRTHLSVLGDAFRRAERNGIAVTRAGDSYLLRAMDVRAMGEDITEALARAEVEERQLRAKLGHAWANASMYDFHSLDKIERDDGSAIASTAPFTIFPFDDELCAALILGWAAYRTRLNLGTLHAYLQRKGWSIIDRPAELPAERDGFLWVRRGTSALRVPLTSADELVVELLTIASFEASVAAGFAQMQAATANQMHITWAWSGEERVWR